MYLKNLPNEAYAVDDICHGSEHLHIMKLFC